MDNIRVLRQIFDDCEAERAMYYDKLSRTLNNSDLSSDPVTAARGIIDKIAHLEQTQEVTVGFMTQIQEDIAKANQQKETAGEDQTQDELVEEEEEKTN